MDIHEHNKITKQEFITYCLNDGNWKLWLNSLQWRARCREWKLTDGRRWLMNVNRAKYYNSGESSGL